MELKAVRRAQLLRESIGYLLLPCLYGALQVAGVFLFSPGLLALSFGLVALLLLQVRSARVAGAMAAGLSGGVSPRAPVPGAAVDAADERFVSQVTYGAGANFLGYFVFLAALDYHVRGEIAGAPATGVLLGGAIASIAVALAGREVARRAAWAGFAEAFPALWSAQDGLQNGRATRSVSEYYDWRLRVERDG